MAVLTEDLLCDGNGRAVPRESLNHLAIGTMVTKNLADARKMYTEFFGLECVEYAPGRMMVRDRRSKYQMEHDERDFFVIDVREVPEITSPQANLNHWGFTVSTTEEVDRIRQLVKADPEKYRLAKILPITKMHQAYDFYFYDVDSNWWEIEYRGERTNDFYFSKGDWNAGNAGETLLIDPVQPIADTSAEVVGPDAFLTHGTTDVIDADVSRRFYEDILGLRPVRHVQPAQYTAGGGQFSVVGVQTGPRNARQTPDNRWVVLVESVDRLDAMHDCAEAARDTYGLIDVTKPTTAADGSRSFLICTADYNWFEVSTRSRADIVAIFNGVDTAA